MGTKFPNGYGLTSWGFLFWHHPDSILTMFFLLCFVDWKCLLSVMETRKTPGKSHNYSEKERRLTKPHFTALCYAQYCKGCQINSWWALFLPVVTNLRLASVSPITLKGKFTGLRKAWCRVRAQSSRRSLQTVKTITLQPRIVELVDYSLWLVLIRKFIFFSTRQEKEKTLPLLALYDKERSTLIINIEPGVVHFG